MARPENDKMWRRNRPLPRASALHAGSKRLGRRQFVWVAFLALASTGLLVLANQSTSPGSQRTALASRIGPAPSVPLVGSPLPPSPPATKDPASAPADRAPTTQASSPLAARPTEQIRLSPPYEVADGLTIVTEHQKVHLAGLDGPASEAACFDQQKRLWPCGLEARAALNNVIRQHDVICRTTGQTVSGLPDAECKVGDLSLARVLVAAGFARPIGQPTATISSELKGAQANQRGLWKGGWRVRGQ